MIHVAGCNGESITLDGSYISKFRHDGKQEAAKNLAATYRSATITARKRRGDAPQQFDVMIACSSFMSLRITEAERPVFDVLVEELERIAGGAAHDS